MVFIRIQKITNEKAQVMFIHNIPNELSEEEKSTGILLETIPKEQYMEGKIAVPYYYYTTNEVVYEYIDRQKTQEELINEKMNLMQKAIDDLLLNGGTI